LRLAVCFASTFVCVVLEMPAAWAKLTVCLALALIGCGGGSVPLVTPDLAELPAAADLAQRQLGDMALASSADLSSAPADLADSPDLWMCTPLGNNCSTVNECCGAAMCDFPFAQFNGPHVCCYEQTHPCVNDSDCCYGNNVGLGTMHCGPMSATSKTCNYY
jgi:hypothetical protein